MPVSNAPNPTAAASSSSASAPAAGGPRLASIELASNTSGRLLPRLDPAPPFLYAWHPNKYRIINGRILPHLRSLTLQPGVNNVSVNRDGKINIARMKMHVEAQGWSIIPWTDGPDGRSYMQEIDVANAAGAESVGYFDVFMKAFPGSSEVGSDLEGLAGWLDELVAREVIPACPAHVAASMLDSVKTRHASLAEQMARGNTRFRGTVTALEREIEILEGYLAKLAKPTAGRPAALDVDETTLDAEG